ncbi:MAG: hypothetical protein IPJ86_18820 [Bacteroidetes bacterium]|nr:hypothetical protein [Bacteroidota bacterium]
MKKGYRLWREYQMSFGIGIKIGVDMPHELKGLIPSVEFYDKIYGEGDGRLLRFIHWELVRESWALT